MTVSATGTGGTPAGYLLQVLVLTGANSTQAGVTAGATNSSGSSTALQLAMTPGAAGNMVFGAAMNWANSTAPTLLASTSNQSTFSDTVNGDWYSSVKSSAVTTTSSTTFGYSTTLTGWQITLAEIQVSAGSALTRRSPVLAR
ncbi:MAG TPA: hypothetical protein DCP11_16590 [Microbacteriaceae bacterium]|nr:hypothetical protein [Microbacteriaceae bacterium]